MNTVNRIFPALLIALFLWGAAKNTKGAHYYISPAGQDTNAGTLLSPWRHMQDALLNLAPGDTLFVRGGTYDDEEIWLNANFGISGSAGKFITVMAYANEKPVYNNPDRPLVISSRYLRIQGLTFVAKNISVRRITDDGVSDYIQLIGNTFTGQSSPPIYFNGSHGLIEDNSIDIAATSSSHGIYVMHGDCTLVRNNRVIGAYFYGIHVYDENKYQYAGENDPRITNTTIDGNFIAHSQSRSGIVVSAGESPQLGITIRNVRISNNVICHSAICGIAVLYYGSIRNLEIYNNTMVNNTYGIQLDAVDLDSVQVINNILAKSSLRHITNTTVNTLRVENNLYWQPAAAGQGMYDAKAIYQDPLFEQPETDDYRLRPTSPAIDIGLDIGLPYSGIAPDLGAWEYLIPVAIELGYFRFHRVDDSVVLEWQTVSETQNAGFEIERKFNGDPFRVIGRVDGQGTTAQSHLYRFRDLLSENGSYSWRLATLETDGSRSYAGTLHLQVDWFPSFFLVPNYPNPFNQSTRISAFVSQKQPAELVITDLSGRSIKTLFHGVPESQKIDLTWDGTDEQKRALPSGIYFCLLTSGRVSDRRKILLIR
ncbi:right-handed parallel beta-helix repeat-containing protein [candidate division KSB1 bacterium]|nr:right-handed parallel beta-helix repeat-containing protein [candidate division KSB1 bacterium]